jgi:hypothetical protein
LALFLLLAACGADGAPVPPAGKTPGITISGEVSAGIVVSGE